MVPILTTVLAHSQYELRRVSNAPTAAYHPGEAEQKDFLDKDQNTLGTESSVHLGGKHLKYLPVSFDTMNKYGHWEKKKLQTSFPCRYVAQR